MHSQYRVRQKPRLNLCPSPSNARISLHYITLHESRLVYANLQYKTVQKRITIVTLKTEKITE